MKLILISDARSSEDEALIITKMFEEGLPTLHLRKRRLNTFETDKWLKKIPEHFHSRIVLHYHHILSAKYSLKGLHYSHDHLKRKWFNLWLQFRLKIKFKNLTKSYSVHSLSSAYKLEAGKFDYVFIGNLFNNITGEFINEFNENNIKALLDSRKDIQWIARGGCTPDIIEKCHALGFSGIAFQSWVWKKENPLERFSLIVNKFREKGIEIA